MKSVTSQTFKTPLCTVAFANGLFKARAVQEGALPKFGATFIFPNTTDRSAFDKAVKEVLAGSWPTNGMERARAGLIKLPFLKGDSKEARNKQTGEIWPGFGPDVWFVRAIATEKVPPLVRFHDQNVQASEQEIYSGCKGKAVLAAFSWQNPQGGEGISFSIRMFQKLAEGERLGGAAPIDPGTWWEVPEGADSSSSSSSGAGSLFDD